MTKPAAGEALGTVQRVIEMLRHLAANGTTTIKDVSAAIGLAPSTCHRMLDLMVSEGLVERDPIRRDYRIGAEFFRLATQVQSHFDIRTLSRTFLQEVVNECGETCVLCLYLPAEGKMTFALQVDSSQLLRYHLPLNTPLSLLWGASGRGILAFLLPDEIERIRASEGPAPASSRKVPSRSVLARDLEEIRTSGYAVSHGDKIAGAVGISAPIFGSGGSVMGCISVTVPEGRITPTAERRLGELVRRVASRLSATLGFQPSESPRAARA